MACQILVLQMTKRIPDWQLAFAKCVAEHQNVPFKWGEQDCVLWAADTVFAITGEDPAKEFRGAYDSALSAARVLREAGGMEKLVSEKMGGTPVDSRLANVGDVVLVLQDGEPMLGVCNGDTLLATGSNGLVALPMQAAVKIWKV